MDVRHTEVWQRAEDDRHWGMICTCQAHVDARLAGKKHITCPLNSCRLDDAWGHIVDSCTAARERARHITEAECENDRELFKMIKRLLNQLASKTHQRFKYLGVAPWSFARTLRVAGAAEFLEKVQDRPLEEHDALTRMLYTKHKTDLEQRAAGGETTPQHQDAVRIMKLSPLDESCGEGYHRGTTHGKKRAAASSSKHLKQAVRTRPSIAKLVAFRKKHGHRAIAVFRHDWRTWKRALQPHASKRWQPLRVSTEAFFSKFYHEDAQADEDWSSIFERMGSERPVVPEVVDERQKLEEEYIRAQLHVGGHFVVPRAVEAIGEDGRPVRTEEPVHFECLNIQHGNKRAQTMDTVEAADDISLTAHLAVEIQPETPWIVPDAPATPGRVHVFAEGAPIWVSPLTLASFTAWHAKAKVFRDLEPCPAPGCIT